jgi:hypothetical protein
MGLNDFRYRINVTASERQHEKLKRYPIKSHAKLSVKNYMSEQICSARAHLGPGAVGC